MNSSIDWTERAFTALTSAEGTASALLTEDFVTQWVSASWLRIFGYDPTGQPAWDVLHPDDLDFSLSVLSHHRDDVAFYAVPLVDELVPPSGEIRIRHADGRWLKCMLRIDNQLNNPEIAAIVVHLARAIDPSGLGRAINLITHGSPIEETLLEVLSYMAEDSIRQNVAPSGVVFTDTAGRRRVVSHAGADIDAVLFGPEVNELPRSPEQVTVVKVRELPHGPMRRMAEELHFGCLWVLRIGEVDDELGLVLSWSYFDFALELRPHMHFSIGCDVVALALNEQRRMHAIRQNAITDPLTGVYNRAGLNDAFDAIRRGPHRAVGALFVDLDDLKEINDQHGHQVGDEVLTEVARRLGALCRSGDVVARIGGDEFAMLCPALDQQSMSAIARRVVTQFEKPVSTKVGDLRVWVSVGTSTADRRTELVELLHHADIAQYEDKRLTKSLRKASTPPSL